MVLTALALAIAADPPERPVTSTRLESIADTIDRAAEPPPPVTAAPGIDSEPDALQPLADDDPNDPNGPPLLIRSPPPPPPDLFGTATIIASAPPPMFGRWQKVRDEQRDPPALQRLVRPARGLRPLQQITFVQRAVYRIPYRIDALWWRTDDYWATAGETLRRNGGDCEDLALVKLQALRALGFDPTALYLSVGRDVGRGDHAVLLIRLAGEWWVLDDRFARPIPAAQLAGFTPIITFSGDTAFIHGRSHAR
ncbi:MAG: transglutaminase-like cysteine peptidase [Sphingomicrobium sp.]